MRHMSGFHLWSTGVVLENKAMSTHSVLVTPVEIVNDVDGELSPEPTTFHGAGINAEGKHYTLSIDSGIVVRADWIGGNNRITSPDVRIGEEVLIFRQGDSDKYFESPTGRHVNLRRLETVVWAISGLPDNDVDIDDLDETNSYYVEASTHKKLVTLSTSQTNGEPFGYKAQLDTDYGKFILEDTVGNHLELDSNLTKITFFNKDGTFITLDKKIIHMFCHDMIKMEADNKIIMNTKDVIINASNSFTLNTKTTSISSSDSITMTTNTMSVTSPTVTYSGKTFTYQGQTATWDFLTFTVTGVVQAGALAIVGPSGGGSASCVVAGPVTAKDTMKIEGPLTATSIDCSGDIKCAKLTSSAPISAPNV